MWVIRIVVCLNECCRGTSKRPRPTGAVEPGKIHGTSFRRHVRPFSDFLRVWWSRDRISMAARFSAPAQTSHGAHQALCTLSTGSLTGLKRPGLSVNHPLHPAIRCKGRPIPVLHLWARMACSKWNLPFHVLISITGSFPFHDDDEQRFDFYRSLEGGGGLVFPCNVDSLCWIPLSGDIGTRHCIPMVGIGTVIHLRSAVCPGCKLPARGRYVCYASWNSFRGQICQLIAVRVDWLMIVTQQVSFAHVRKVPIETKVKVHI